LNATALPAQLPQARMQRTADAEKVSAQRTVFLLAGLQNKFGVEQELLTCCREPFVEEPCHPSS